MRIQKCSVLSHFVFVPMCASFTFTFTWTLIFQP